MAKPILIVRVPSQMPNDEGDKLCNRIEQKLAGEYHVLVARCLSYNERVQFECINPDNLPKLTEEIKREFANIETSKDVFSQ